MTLKFAAPHPHAGTDTLSELTLGWFLASCTSSPRGDGYGITRFPFPFRDPRCTSSPRGDGYRSERAICSWSLHVAPHPHAGTDTPRRCNRWSSGPLHLIPTRGRIRVNRFYKNALLRCCTSSPRGDGYAITTVPILTMSHVAPHPHAGTDTD